MELNLILLLLKVKINHFPGTSLVEKATAWAANAAGSK